VEWRSVLEPGEIATCIKSVSLKVGRGPNAPTRPFIAVGTGVSGGEDVPTWGRILLFEITRQVSPIGQSQPFDRKIPHHPTNHVVVTVSIF
jgi:hypothetical protein